MKNWSLSFGVSLFLYGSVAQGTVFQTSYQKIQNNMPMVCKGIPFYSTYQLLKPAGRALIGAGIDQRAQSVQGAGGPVVRAIGKGLGVTLGVAIGVPITLIKEVVFVPYELIHCQRTHRLRKELNIAKKSYKYIQGAYMEYAKTHPTLRDSMESDVIKEKILDFYFSSSNSGIPEFDHLITRMTTPAVEAEEIARAMIRIDAWGHAPSVDWQSAIFEEIDAQDHIVLDVGENYDKDAIYQKAFDTHINEVVAQSISLARQL